MLTEQIKKYIDEKFDENSKVLNLLTLPLVSQYRVYVFAGTTNLSTLDLMFDLNEVRGRYIVIKSIKIDYYRDPGGSAIADIAFSDGTNEDLATSVRINRVFDLSDTSMDIKMKINGTDCGIFGNNVSNVSYPADLFLDNIYFKYNSKVQDWSFRVNGGLATAPDDNTLCVVFAKVTIECYLI